MELKCGTPAHGDLEALNSNIMKKTNKYSLIAIVILIAVICCAYWNASNNKQEYMKSAGEKKSTSHRNSRAISKSNIENSKNTAVSKAKYKIFDERTGMTIHYDRIATGDDFVKIFQEMTPKLAAKYAKANIKMYLRGNSIVMLQKNEGAHMSISRSANAKAIMKNKNWLKITNSTSDYLNITDRKKMGFLLNYLNSGWSVSGRYKTVYEKTLVMIEVTPTEKYIKRKPKSSLGELGVTYPAFLKVESKGMPSKRDSVNDRNYPREMSVRRLFSIQAIIRNSIDHNANPYECGLGTGSGYLEEPTPKAVELYGIRY